jgi:Common central domain of tyrosinase
MPPTPPTKRKEIRSLSFAERNRLTVALLRLKTRPSASLGNFNKYNYVQLAQMHNPPYAPHMGFGRFGTTSTAADPRTFLLWHRKYIYLFERALQDSYFEVVGNLSASQSIFLPYWNPLKNPSTPNPIPVIPAQLGTLINSNTFSQSSIYSGTVSRSPSNMVGSWANYVCDLRTQIKMANIESTFDAFSGIVNSNNSYPYGILTPHDNVHMDIVGGWMSSIKQAAYDPLFWMHHANIDRIWMNWQGASPPPSRLPMFSSTMQFPVVPPQPISTVSSNSMIGSDLCVVIQDGGTYNYTYVDEVVNLSCPPPQPQNIIVVTGMGDALQSMRIEIYFNAPAGDIKLHRGIENYAGTINVFAGHDPSHQMSPSPREFRSSRFAIVTDAYARFSGGGRPPEKVDFRAYTLDNVSIPLEQFNLRYEFKTVVTD